MKYIIEFSKRADTQFEKLERSVKKRIVNKLEWFVKTGKPLKYAKKLTNPKIEIYRFRIGNYRVLFDMDRNGNIMILHIISIKHRRNVYD